MTVPNEQLLRCSLSGVGAESLKVFCLGDDFREG